MLLNPKSGFFWKGGKVRKNEKWVFRNNTLEIVNNFTYLGKVFNFDNTFSKAKKQLTASQKATFLSKKNVKSMYLNHKALLFLFDCYVGPIVIDCPEIWGPQKDLNVDRIHLEVCRHILDVIKSTCTAAVYTELGRFPLHYHRKFSLIIYWPKFQQLYFINYKLL